MHLQLTQDFGAWKTGDITDDLHPEIARGLIAAGQAKESDPMSFVRAANQSELKKMREELAEVVRSTLSQRTTTTTGPPTGTGKTGTDQGVVRTLEAQTIEHSSSPVDRSVQTLKEDAGKGGDCFPNILRMVERVGKPHKFPSQLVEHDNNVLRQISVDASEYRFNETSGQFEFVTTRALDGGGTETITRTGGDSLSGGATYGFTVKPEYITSLYRIAREQSVFEPFTRPVTVGQGVEAIWPQFDQFQAPTMLNGVMQSAIFGGVTVSFTGEATPRVSSDGKTRQNRFKIVDATAFTAFSRDYRSDAYIPMEGEITRTIGEAMGYTKDWTYIRGNGIGMPQGYFNANSALTSGPNAGARENSNKISSDDLMYMMSRMGTMCWSRMYWIANVTTYTQLGILRDFNGIAVFQPNAVITQADLQSLMRGSSMAEDEMVTRPMGMLLGKPIYFTEKVPTLGTTGDISLVCPYHYGNATRLGLEVGVSEHFYFSTDLIAYRFKERYFGRSLWPTTYIQADNTGTPASGTVVTNFFILHS